MSTYNEYLHERALECLKAVESITDNSNKEMEHAICLLIHSALEYELLYRYGYVAENMMDVVLKPSFDELILLVDDAPSFVEVYHVYLSDYTILRNGKLKQELTNIIKQTHNWIAGG